MKAYLSGSRCRSVLALLTCSVTAWAGLASDWPQFRGPQGDGRATAERVPVAWGPSQNIAWRAELPGLGWSSPVVSDGRVYVTTAVPLDGGDYSLRILCVDARSGAVLWNEQAFAQPAGAAPHIHDKNSHASATPIVEGEHIYAHFGHMGTACFTRDGRAVWRNQALRYQPVHGNGGSPVLVDEKLIFSVDGADRQFIAALEKQTGQLLWQTGRSVEARAPFTFSTPLLIEHEGRRQIISQASGAVYAYDPDGGDELWRVMYPGGYSVVPRPVYGGGLVYVCTGFNTPDLLAIRPDGRGDVTGSHVVWKHRRGVPLTSSPLRVDDRIFFISDGGIATCVDAVSGTLIWQERVGGNFSASPVYAAGKIYFQSEEGRTTVIRAADEYQEIARSDLGERTLASPAVADGALFLRTDKALYRIENAESESSTDE